MTAEFFSVVRAQQRPIDLGDGGRQGIRDAGSEAPGALELPRLERGADLACGPAQTCVKGHDAFSAGEVQIGEAHNDVRGRGGT